MDLTDPQQWNAYAYAYANNSPATLSDPSGLIPADCREFDCYGYDPRPLKKGDGRGAGGCPGGCGTKKNTAWGKKNKRSTTKSKKNIHPTVLKVGPTSNAEEEPSGGGVPARQAAWCVGMAGANCALGYALSRMAIARADKLKNDFRWINGERNAFRHSFWMALMTAHGFSIDEALAFGAAHERDGDTPGQMWGSEDSNTDLHNNEVGARIGAKVRSKLAYVAPASGAAYQKIEARLLAMLDGYDPSMGPYTRSTRDGNLRLIPPK